jgi:hypothetical protein
MTLPHLAFNIAASPIHIGFFAAQPQSSARFTAPCTVSEASHSLNHGFGELKNLMADDRMAWPENWTWDSMLRLPVPTLRDR